VLLSYPQAVAVDRVGNVYFTDGEGKFSDGDATVIRKSTHFGEVTTLAGARRQQGSTDGTGAAARFHMAGAIALAVDSAGNIYVPDSDNHTVRKVTPAGVVTTIVGVAGKRGFAAGPLPGLLEYPHGVALSGTSLYITLRNGVAVVRNVP
jgi:hypothetical protein